MGSTADKASGIANEAIGKAKQGIGSAVGSDKLRAEGTAQEIHTDPRVLEAYLGMTPEMAEAEMRGAA